MNREAYDGPYRHADLLGFSKELLQRVGAEQSKAETVAEILLEGDLMGHTTHGMQMLRKYLDELEQGKMKGEGDPIIISDNGSALCWDGCYLPGPWLTVMAIEKAMGRLEKYPVVTAVIQRSHHIASLASYPKIATDRGFMMLLVCSDPSTECVAPYGGITPVYTPDPLAAGIPTAGKPIIIDISMSTVALGPSMRMRKEDRLSPQPWYLDGHGNPTGDAGVLFQDPPGSILPLGGVDLGYKGFALGLLIEALTSALGGVGRAAGVDQFGASVFLQLIDPEAFGGREKFLVETEWLSQACRASQTKPGSPPVRLPGERALSLREEQLESGVHLYPGILGGLKDWADKLGVPMPESA